MSLGIWLEAMSSGLGWRSRVAETKVSDPVINGKPALCCKTCGACTSLATSIHTIMKNEIRDEESWVDGVAVYHLVVRVKED